MRSFLAALMACGSLGWSAALAATPPAPVLHSSSGITIAQTSTERLSEMFSTEIQETIAACWDQGKVNLDASAGPNDWVVCGDGSVLEGVTYASYLETVGDVMIASTLAGMRVAVDQDPRLTPELLAMFVSTSEGQEMMKSIVQSSLITSELQSPDNAESIEVMTDWVALGLVDNLSNPTRLDNLLGPLDQYDMVVTEFCNAPGMPISEALEVFPNHDAIQLYSVCIEESGLATELSQ